MLGEGFGAISTLQQEALSRRDAAERLFEAAGFACKHKWRKRRKPPLDRGERRLIRIFGDLDDRLAAPTVARPTLGHDGPPPRLSPSTGEIFQFRGTLYTSAGAASQMELRSAGPAARTKRGLFGRLAPTAQRLLPERHQLLGGGRMHRDDGVDVGL